MNKFINLVWEIILYLVALFTLTSIIGLRKMFNKWHKSGLLSLVSFTRGWIFSKDSKLAIRLIYSISDGIILILTPIYYWLPFGNFTHIIKKLNYCA